MYDSYAQWRNQIRAAQKAHRLLTESLKITSKLQTGMTTHHYLLRQAIEILRSRIEREEVLLEEEQASAKKVR